LKTHASRCHQQLWRPGLGRIDKPGSRTENIGKSQLDLIANGFLNKPTGGTHQFQFKTADAAYKAIRRVFVERAQDESKARIIKRMTG